MNGFYCPICREALQDTGHALVCPNRHSFDKAKSGYVHLMPSVNGQKNHGDNKDMVLARRDFLDTGAYAHLREAVGRVAAQLVKEQAVVLDSGCGEGYYTEVIAAAVPASATVLGFDISKDAVNLAAKRCKAAQFAVASAFHIPMADETVDVLFELFSPFSEAEFQRILRPGGYLVEVIPGIQHLYALKEAVYDHPYRNEVAPFVRAGYQLTDSVHLEKTILLKTAQDIRHLFLMTPYYYKTGKTEQARLQALETLETQTDFHVLVYRKTT